MFIPYDLRPEIGGLDPDFDIGFSDFRPEVSPGVSKVTFFSDFRDFGQKSGQILASYRLNWAKLARTGHFQLKWPVLAISCQFGRVQPKTG